MKNGLLGMVALGWLLVVSVRGDLIAYEGFDLTQGENALGSGAGATSSGWSGTWTATTVDVSPGLSYGSLATVGGAARLDAANSGGFRNFASSISGGTTWVSFIGVVSNTASYAGFSIFNGFGNERIFVGDTSSGGNWGFQSPGLTPAFTTGVSSTNVSLLVLRVDWNAGVTNNEHVYLWVNPALGVEPDILAADISLTTANLNPAGASEVMTRVRIQQGGSSDNAVLDEIRIGTTWNDVSVVVPEPGASALMLVGFAMMGWLRGRSRRVVLS
jgi:hypothetical protein